MSVLLPRSGACGRFRGEHHVKNKNGALQALFYFFGHGREFLRVSRFPVFLCEVAGLGNRDEFYVRVRDFQAFNDQGNTQAPGGFLDGRDQVLGHQEQFREPLVIHIERVLDFLLGDHEGHPRLDGVDVQKGEMLVIFPDFMGGDVSIDDFGEKGRHSGAILSVFLTLP